METAAEMIERVKRRMETEPFAISLTKMQWAQILGILQAVEFATDDIRHEGVLKLVKAIGTALGMEVQ